MFTLFMTLSFVLSSLILNLKILMSTFPLTTCIVGILLLFFFFRLKLASDGIPLWFRCFKGKQDPDAFSLSLINEGISYVYDLFKSKNYNLIFLADRWFNFREIMQHIESLSCTYCIRTKTNVAIEIDNFEYSVILSLFSLSLLFSTVLELLVLNFKLNLLLAKLILMMNLSSF